MWPHPQQQAQPQQSQQQHWPPFDPGMPPPPPRGPWANEPPGHQQPLPPPGPPVDLQSRTHKKVSRQYSLNPAYDPRIQALPKQQLDFSVPPPPLISTAAPPPSAASQHHLPVSRNASAPEGQPTGNASGYPEAMPNVTSMYAATSHAQIGKLFLRPIFQNNFQKIYFFFADKTMSWSSDMSGAVSPLITSSGNVWDSTTNKTVANNKDSRADMYYHLAKIFDEHKVRQAMASLPDETDAQVICKQIIEMDTNNKRC